MDAAEFDRIYKKYHPMVKAAAKTYIKDTELCADICQEVFEKLLKLPRQIKEPMLHFWLLTVTKNTSLDHIKKHMRTNVQMDVFSNLEDKGTTLGEPLRYIIARERGIEIMEALRKHDPVGMEILLAIEIEGRKAKELAAQYGMTPNNLRTRLYRVKKWLNEHYPDEGFF